MDYIMETVGLRKAYKDNIVVDDVNMHISKGAIYGFVGPNGAGKSTVMKMILSYLLHTEYRRTQPPVEVVDGHQKALPILLFLKLMCKKLRFVCHFRSFQFGRKFWILEGHRRDVTHKRSATAHAVDLSITNTL